MSADFHVLNLGDYVNPIERLMKGYCASGGSQEGLHLLEKALALAVDLDVGRAERADQAREYVRRNITLETAELRRLTNAANRIGVEHESAMNQYALLEFVQAAAVGNADLADRNNISYALANAAQRFGRLEVARSAYADVLEGIQILTRFFQVDPAMHERAEAQIRRTWAALQTQYPGQADLLGSLQADPADDWEKVLIWNTDMGRRHGTLAQADSQLRLALRMEYWQDEAGKDLTTPVEHLAERINARAKSGDDWLAARCRLALADALMEVSRWDLALAQNEQAILEAKEMNQEAIWVHAVAQAACCELMAGDGERSLARLSTLDWKGLESLASIVAAVAADVARLVALHHASRKMCGLAPPPDTTTKLREHMDTLAVIINDRPKNRREYLQSIFVATTARDVNSILSAAC